MVNMSRRDVLAALSAVAAIGAVGAEAQTSPGPEHTSATPAKAPSADHASASLASASLASARVFRLDQMPTRKMANGGESVDCVRGILATGEAVNLHESVQPAGVAPNPLHVIHHSEFILVREGEIDFEHDGKAERVGPGDAIYVAHGTLHTLRNVGNGPAKYFVVGIGGDIRK